MPHKNGKIYSEVVNGVKVGINTDDVGAVIGDASHDVKTLCISKRINPAAVFRPRYTSSSTAFVHIGPEEFDTKLKNLVAPLSGDSKIQMKCIKYGIWVPYFNRLDEGYPYYASRIRWNPRPCDETQYGDLTHFDGYDHGAKFKNPVQSVVCAVGSKVQVVFQDNSTSESITAQTLFGDSDYAYFGFILYEYQGEAPILSGSGAVTPTVHLDSGNVYMASGQARVVNSNVFAKSGYNYDIIPIVATDYNGDYEYYSLNISDSVPGRITKSLFIGNIEFVFFRFSEGTFYPDGNTIGTGNNIGVDKTTFGFALMMSQDLFSSIISTNSNQNDGLIRRSSIKIKAKFTRSGDNTVYTNIFTESNGLVIPNIINKNLLKMYIQTTGNSNKVYEWAQSAAGTLAGYFDFDISFTINIDKSGHTENLQYPAVSWM